MPQYSLSQLIARANAGNIGARGIKRLQSAGIGQGMTSDSWSGLRQSPADHPLSAPAAQPGLQVAPADDLAARRAALYAHALQTAHDAPPGTALSAGIQRRLQLGVGGGQNTSFAPSTAQGALAFQGSTYDTLLGAIKKRATGIASQAGIYKF